MEIGRPADARLFEDCVNRLGAELATLLDDDPRAPEMTRWLHDVCDAAHAAEEHWQQMKTGRAMNAARWNNQIEAYEHDSV